MWLCFMINFNSKKKNKQTYVYNKDNLIGKKIKKKTIYLVYQLKIFSCPHIKKITNL